MEVGRMDGFEVLLAYCSMTKFIVGDVDIEDVVAGGRHQLEIL